MADNLSLKVLDRSTLRQDDTWCYRRLEAPVSMQLFQAKARTPVRLSFTSLRMLQWLNVSLRRKP